MRQRVHIDRIGERDVEVIQVVRTTLSRRGKGTEGDPIRRITQFWSLDGELLAEVDPYEKPVVELQGAEIPR